MRVAKHLLLLLAVFATFGQGEQSCAAEPEGSIWDAAATGNIKAVKKRLDAGVEVDARDPQGVSTALVVASAHGQTEVARLLIQNGADVNAANKDGGTALHAAAFFCHADIVKMLLENGADARAKNHRGETPLDTVKGEWSRELAEVYTGLGRILDLQLDLEEVRQARPEVAALLSTSLSKAEGARGAAEAPVKSTGIRGAYFRNGEIHVNTYGAPEGEPLTSGHQDFKPSWSKTGDMLVFFRRLKDDPVVTNWKTQVCVINVDGTGLHELTDGTHTDFNQTWTRDGTNTPIWNRRNPENGGFQVMASQVGAKPGQEIALTDKKHHTWAYSCLIDGRILVQCAHPEQGWGYFLMTPYPEGESRFQRIDCELARAGILDRISISPSETKVCFEYLKGFEYRDPGRTLYIADFSAERPGISNARPFANEEGADRWFAYPRWTKDETAIVYHASPSLYLYTLDDETTVKVSTRDDADYRYPHCEAAPK